MAPNQLILNGNFSAGSANWSGTDIELNPYTSYGVSGGSNPSAGTVTEMDGRSGYRTVLQQTVTVARDGQTGTFSFDTALRSALTGNPSSGAYTVQIVNATTGTPILSQTISPTSTTWINQSYTVTFPSAGNYIIRFTEAASGADDSLGAVLDNVSLLVCFVAGSLIRAEHGPLRVEEVQPGMRLWTVDHGLQTVRWSGRRRISLAQQLADPALRPVVFEPGSLGAGQPARRVRVSQQHRMCLQDWRSQLYFGESEVLVPAKALVDGDCIRIDAPELAVTYVHFLFDRHEIVEVDGCLTESFLPTGLSLGGVEQAAQDEILRFFPQLRHGTSAIDTARPVLSAREALVLAA
ncbi:hemolysin [Gemmobacter lutimaris]|uniref:Hemolysin n=1 Tax=Gemmobacter lutimaris TaxID=2306023 RepID=A0A398BUI2_9RHOB|nr:Hint domain-containing protein [Gemmobacter lutimaris]RID93207.1 hemolysin [Gemmobacter lutimaris]